MYQTSEERFIEPILLAEQRRASQRRRERERASVDEAYGDWLELTYREKDRPDGTE